MKKLFLGIVVCALLFGSGFLFVDKASSKTIELKLAHFMSPKHVQHTDVMLPFAEAVKKATAGRVKITIYPGGALGRPPQQYDAAVTGIVDIAYGLHSYTPGKFPLVSVLEVVEGTVIPVSGIYDFNLHEVAKYLTVGNFYVSTFFMAMNKDAWNKISSKDQGIIEGLIGKKMSDKAGATYDSGGKLGYQACKKAGINIYSLPPNELAKWKKALMPLHEKWVAGIEAKGLPGKAIYNAAIKFSKEYR